MQVRHVSIRNFRGIRELDWVLPDKKIFCLVGRGDSTKSTILEAILCAFHPQWNLAFDDADFHGCASKNSIKIEIIVTDFPESLRDLAHYGHWLCGWSLAKRLVEADPGEELEDALRVRLVVQDDLEPKWSVIKKADEEGIAFKPNDRGKAAVSLIGTFTDRHLTWGRGSVLSQLTKTENLTSALANAGRAAKVALDSRRDSDLASFDAVARTAETTAKSLGVVVASNYRAHLDADAVNVRIGGLSLHDGDMPLRQLGLGSKRMLTTGLQTQALQAPHITLCDEIEIGLEPHRIARLLQHLKEDRTGQYFLTTHSPVVLRELAVDDLHVVHSRNGLTEVIAANNSALAETLQGNMRAGAEAFLAPKIVVCEGATEAGFMRGLDRYWTGKGKRSFAYQGVAPFDANGSSKINGVASGLVDLHYDVCVLADSDDPEHFSEAQAAELRRKGVVVAMWTGGVSIEERVIADLPWAGVMASFDVAASIRQDTQLILDNVQSQYGAGFPKDPSSWRDEPRLRAAIGKAAKASDWFKRQTWGFEWAKVITPYLDDAAIQHTDLVARIAALRAWVDRA